MNEKKLEGLQPLRSEYDEKNDNLLPRRMFLATSLAAATSRELLADIEEKFSPETQKLRELVSARLAQLTELGYKIEPSTSLLLRRNPMGPLNEAMVFISNKIADVESKNNGQYSTLDDLNHHYKNVLEFIDKSNPYSMTPDLRPQGPTVKVAPLFLEIVQAPNRPGLFQVQIKSDLTGQVLYQKIITLENTLKQYDESSTTAEIIEASKKIREEQALNIDDQLKGLLKTLGNKTKFEAEISSRNDDLNLTQEKINSFWDNNNDFTIVYSPTKDSSGQVNNVDDRSINKLKFLTKNEIKKPTGAIEFKGQINAIQLWSTQGQPPYETQNYVDKYGNVVNSTTTLEAEGTARRIIVINVSPTFVEATHAGKIAPCRVDLEPLGLPEIPPMFYQKVTALVQTEESVGIYARDPKWVKEHPHKLKWVAQGMALAEKNFGANPGQCVDKLEVVPTLYSSAVAFSYNNFPKIIIVGLNHLRTQEKLAQKNQVKIIDEMRGLGLHEAYHVITTKLFLNDDEFFVFFNSLSDDFRVVLSEGNFLPKEPKNSGHAYDNKEELLASFLVDISDPRGPGAFKNKPDWFKMEFYKTALYLYTRLHNHAQIPPDAPILELLKEYTKKGFNWQSY